MSCLWGKRVAMAENCKNILIHTEMNKPNILTFKRIYIWPRIPRIDALGKIWNSDRPSRTQSWLMSLILKNAAKRWARWQVATLLHHLLELWPLSAFIVGGPMCQESIGRCLFLVLLIFLFNCLIVYMSSYCIVSLVTVIYHLPSL